ncbi:MAG: porin family protein [Agriterribacter sp.]
MKKVVALFGTCMLLGVVAVKAQKAGVMVKAGLNLANVTVDKDGAVDDARGIASFHAGLQADLPITRFFAIQPGLFFTGKGTKVEWNNITSSTKPYYLELPVNAVIKLPLGEDANFFFGAGPYVAMGVGGKNKISGSFAGIDFKRTENIKFSDDDPFTEGEQGAGYGIMRRFDYGLNGTVGLEGKRALFSVNYGLGLAKLQSGTSSSEDELGKHRVLSFSVGIKL